MNYFVYKFFTILLITCISFVNSKSQNFNVLNNNSTFNTTDELIYKLSFKTHTSIKPILENEVDTLFYKTNYSEKYWLKSKLKKNISKIIWNKLFNEHLINLKIKKFNLTIDPLLELQTGREIHSKKNIWLNTRGFFVQGKVGEKFWFSSGFYENQATFPSYLDSIIRKNQIIPGQGKYRIYKETGYDYAYSFGHISYSPSKYFNFQLGHGKNFWGDGYRSLILSDVAYNYPYFKITTKVWHLKYTNLYAEFQDINHRNSYTDGFHKKYGAFHYLSWNISKRLELSLFEAIIWQGRDSINNRSFDINYLNPVIFYRPVEFSVGSPDNALMGLNLRYTIGNNTSLYGQVVLDEFTLAEVKAKNGYWGNKQAFQIGFKTWIPIGDKEYRKRGKEESQISNFNSRFQIPDSRLNFPLSHIYLQSEFNYVRPYMYTHSNTIQNYGHYNQSLAHPLGANFLEWLSIIRYNYKRFFIEAKYSWARYGEDSLGANYGRDIYLSYYTRVDDYNNYVAQGEKTSLTHITLKLSWLINPAYNLHISFGVSDVLQKTETNNMHNTLMFFGLKTNIRNIYYDY